MWWAVKSANRVLPIRTTTQPEEPSIVTHAHLPNIRWLGQANASIVFLALLKITFTLSRIAHIQV